MQIVVVPGNTPAVLGMPDIKLLNMLYIKCNTIQMSWQMKQVDEQKVEVKCYTDKKLNSNP